MSRFPFPRYPNGWFQVAYVDELPNGGVLPLKYFGRDLVLFRGDDGAPHVLDAHCPHLGAHLGYGGRVEGNCIRCPFHAWQFDGTGRCTTVPYSEKPPPAKAKIKPWTVREVNGLILVWHHMHSEAPAWEVPPVEEYQSAEWTPYEKRRWKIKTHNQEMAENAVDSAHFHYVHGTVEKPKSEAVAEGHILRVLSETKMRTPMGKVTGSVESISLGFGYSTTRFKGIVETLLVAGITPIDDDYVDVRFSFMVRKAVDKDVTSTVGKAFMAEIERQLGQDIPIWENKIYVSPPLVVDGDGPIGVFRRWVKQFYSEPKTPESLPVLAS
jgi:phenylpropionate dioxygenase-like ring-hydroxylating dioxygenase large terminal subunit